MIPALAVIVALPAPSSGTYYLWVNQSGGISYGGGNKSARVYNTVLDSSRYAVASQDSNGYYTSGRTLYPLTGGQTYTIRISSYGGSTGDYAVGINQSSFLAPGSAVTPLSLNAWENGELLAASPQDYYSFTATGSGTYYLWTNQFRDGGDFGDGFKTAKIYRAVLSSGGGLLWSSVYTGNYITAISFPVTSGETYYVRIDSYNSSTGTYAVGVTQANVSPDVWSGPRISSITYPAGGTPTVSSDYTTVWTQTGGKWQSPASTGDGTQTSKIRVDFNTTAPNANVIIHLEVSSENYCDFAFVGNLDDSASTMNSGWNAGRLSGDGSNNVFSTIVVVNVPTAGPHFIEVGYGKNSSQNSGQDCAWFTIE
ncbi:hypothetical protein AGMMS50267_07010 [Spirochaetia bacterium]|nr:hypothetical protein AGMMS50267_07010 [Spirochaetia bacterium]